MAILFVLKLVRELVGSHSKMAIDIISIGESILWEGIWLLILLTLTLVVICVSLIMLVERKVK